jgi:hypothetical protein
VLGVVPEEDEEEDETVSVSDFGTETFTRQSSYMKVKLIHWTPSCVMPSRPATQWNVSSSLQQVTSRRDWGRRRMLANAEVADVVPSRTKYGEMPSDVPRLMIRTCCGR